MRAIARTRGTANSVGFLRITNKGRRAAGMEALYTGRAAVDFDAPQTYSLPSDREARLDDRCHADGNSTRIGVQMES